MAFFFLDSRCTQEKNSHHCQTARCVQADPVAASRGNFIAWVVELTNINCWWLADGGEALDISTGEYRPLTRGLWP